MASEKTGLPMGIQGDNLAHMDSAVPARRGSRRKQEDHIRFAITRTGCSRDCDALHGRELRFRMDTVAIYKQEEI